MTGALAIGAFILSLVQPKTLGPWWVEAILVVLSYVWVLAQPLDSRRDDVLPALAVLLSAFGLALVARLAPDLARKQVDWLLVSLGLAIVLGPTFTRFRAMAAYKYVWVAASLALFVLLLLFGESINGARLWIRFGSIHYEPVELIKLFIVLFLAAYLAETSDVIATARRVWTANARYLGPLFLGWGASMLILILQHDIGMASLLLLTFATILYVATRRLDIVLAGFVVFGLTALWASHHYPYVGSRIAVWLHPFADPYGRGYQSAQGYFSLAAGGFFGTGYRLGHPQFIPDAATDYVFAAIAEEFGWIGAAALLMVFFAIVRRILIIGVQQPDLYAKLLCVGLAATIGLQVLIIVGGVVGLFPLTGITLPFISYGGSSLLANFLLVSLAWAVSAKQAESNTSA
ncbi:MAG: FtsW/RodA/SpoVE family cell cycle protein [Candidatus Tyrphobacter sp.]